MTLDVFVLAVLKYFLTLIFFLLWVCYNHLFQVEILMKEDKFEYSTDPAKFEPKLIEIFEHAIKSVQSIPQLDPSIMEDIFWTHIPMLNSVHPMEPCVQNWRNRSVHRVCAHGDNEYSLHCQLIAPCKSCPHALSCERCLGVAYLSNIAHLFTSISSNHSSPNSLSMARRWRTW